MGTYDEKKDFWMITLAPPRPKNPNTYREDPKGSNVEIFYEALYPRGHEKEGKVIYGTMNSNWERNGTWFNVGVQS